MIITNALSLNMLAVGKMPTSMQVYEVTLEKARALAAQESFTSAVGHADTAKIISAELGVDVPMNRVSLEIKEGKLLVGQYTGPRLPEGASTLPEGAKIKWLVVEVHAFQTDLRGVNGG